MLYFPVLLSSPNARLLHPSDSALFNMQLVNKAPRFIGGKSVER